MPLIAVEVVLGFVVPVGWGAWELVSLRRERRRDAEKAARAMSTTGVAATSSPLPASPEPLGHPAQAEAGTPS